MRLGVIDVGSNTVHFLVVDAYYGGHPLPAFSHRPQAVQALVGAPVARALARLGVRGAAPQAWSGV